ncbi:unnamed protein product, partial [Thlaspi arvense]
MSRGGGELEERLLNGSETEQRRESFYLRKKIWSEVRKMWRIALPSTLFRVMSFGCIVVAQAFIGHSSETGLAAYALIQSTFIRFIYGVMAGMSSATETLCGQAYGAQQYHMMGIYLQRSWIVDIFTATLFVPFIVFAGPILRLLGQNVEITKTVDEIYLWVIPYLYSIVFTMTMQMYLQAQMRNAIIGVLSTLALVLDIAATWWCVSVMGMGIHGALLGLNISSWSVVIAEFVYVFGGWCPLTWTGFSTAAFVDLIPMLKVLVYEHHRINVWIYRGCKYCNFCIFHMPIYLHLGDEHMLGLVGVRVANELGRGDADAVRFSIKVVLVVSAVIGVICSALCLAFGGQISYLFSDSHQVSDAVADLSIVLSISILLNIVQPILSGVAIGAGLQSVVAIVNLASYYAIGVPFGFILIFILDFGVKGLWSGMLGGVGIQTLALSYVIYKTDWEMEVKKTNERMKIWSLKSHSVESSTNSTRDEERK